MSLTLFSHGTRTRREDKSNTGLFPLAEPANVGCLTPTELAMTTRGHGAEFLEMSRNIDCQERTKKKKNQTDRDLLSVQKANCWVLEELMALRWESKKTRDVRWTTNISEQVQKQQQTRKWKQRKEIFLDVICSGGWYKLRCGGEDLFRLSDKTWTMEFDLSKITRHVEEKDYIYLVIITSLRRRKSKRKWWKNKRPGLADSKHGQKFAGSTW